MFSSLFSNPPAVQPQAQSLFTNTPTAQTQTQSLATNAANDVLLANSPAEAITSIHFGVTQATANYLLATSWSKEVGIWEVAGTGQNVQKLKQLSSCGILCSTWSGDGSRVFIGGTDGQLRAWNIQNNTLSPVGTHSAGIKEVFHSTDLNCVVTGSWDKTIKYWDLRSQNPVATVNVSDRIYAMDMKGHLLVVGTADKKLTVFSLKTPQTPFRAPYDSPLKCQTRCISCFPDMTGFALGSIEGRVGLQYVEEKDSTRNFAFRCHRDTNPTNDVYSVNSIVFHQPYGTFATCGSDGHYLFWDKDSRQRLKLFPKLPNSITCAQFNLSGNLFAYGVGYDWSKGADQYNQRKSPNGILVHILKDEEIRKKSATTK